MFTIRRSPGFALRMRMVLLTRVKRLTVAGPLRCLVKQVMEI